MDQTLLVSADRDVGVQIVEALNRAKVPVTLSDWIYVPELDEWQMIIATPWFDTKGPRAAYTALVDSPDSRRHLRTCSDSPGRH